MSAGFFPALGTYIEGLIDTFAEVPEHRKEALQKIADYVDQARRKGEPAQMIFICTHNSRRSHLSQIWAQTAAAFYEVPVHTFSGGTETTAFHPNAVAALRRVGFDIQGIVDSPNPRYQVRHSDQTEAFSAFSKVFDEAPNPVERFCAVMVCSQADEACPFVPGAAKRIALPYEDPKIADGGPKEAATYDARTREIGRDLLYAFSLIERST